MTLFNKASKVVSLLSHIRYRDAIIFDAPCIVGLAIFFPALSPTNAAKVLFLSLGSFLVMAYIFALNDWADIRLDNENTDKREHTFLSGGISSREMLALSGSLAAAGVVAIAMVSATLGLVAILIVLLGLAYSFPIRGLQGKGIPVLSSALHFVCTCLTFLLGSAAFVPIGTQALLIACYFGILITAGHLVQEVQDYSDDRLAGIRTNAVQFGQKPIFVLSFVLFGFSFLYLIGLAQARLIPPDVKYISILYPIYAVWAIGVYRTGLISYNVKRLRNQYRMLFAIVILALLIEALIQKVA